MFFPKDKKRITGHCQENVSSVIRQGDFWESDKTGYKCWAKNGRDKSKIHIWNKALWDGAQKRA